MTTEKRLADNLVRLFDAYAVHTGLAVSTLCRQFAGDPRLYDKAQSGSSTFTVRLYDKVVAGLHHVWPAVLPWPEDVEVIRAEDLPPGEPIRKRGRKAA